MPIGSPRSNSFGPVFWDRMKVRTEQQIFNDLGALCATPGYAHALAFLCFRDSFVKYGEELSGQDYAKLFSFDRLIRTEISTLLGLMVRAPIDLTLPDPQKFSALIAQSDALLKELHEAMMAPFAETFKAVLSEPHASPFTSAEAMREPIFYAAESAYSFQYRDLAPRKYSRDSAWLLEHKGFSVDQARLVAKAIMSFLHQHLMVVVQKLRDVPREQRTILDGFIFSAGDLIEQSGVPADVVENVLQAFSYPNDANPTFTALHEFNATNAYPLLRLDERRYLLFQYVSLVEALYDTPYFWMLSDKAYRDTAAANRGTFTEEFAAERLAHVFGAANVFRGVEILQSKAKTLGEIDVLVLYANRAVVVQAKSKRLTLVARKGNDLQLQADFKGAIQDACDQALECSQLLFDASLRFVDADGNDVSIPESIKAVHPVCLVSDHYPALSFQALQFLKERDRAPEIKAPLICDVFFLDAVTEMLETPLRCLSYLELRALAGNNILASHELTALGFHLKQNLWLGEADMLHLLDDLSADLDVAMAVRRDGVKGKATPDGLLTLLDGTSVGRSSAILKEALARQR